MVALASEAQEFTIADVAFRRANLFVRWALLVTWITCVQLDILDVSPTALWLSSIAIGAVNAFYVGTELRGIVPGPRVDFVLRYTDIVLITICMISLHDVRNPVWAVYFLSIVGAAHVVSRKEMITYVGWTSANYLAFALITALGGHDVSWAYVTIVMILIYFTGLNAAILSGGEQRLRDVMAAAASTDSLTGLPNRRRFHTDYGHYLAEAIEKRIPLTLMLVDVDHFKEINDRDGHPAGDDKLREVASAFQSVMRGNDLVARYGGDEFVVIAPNTNLEGGLGLAERLRTAAGTVSMSVSIGVAIFPTDAETPESLVESADAALYRAKQAGRNCVRGSIAA